MIKFFIFSRTVKDPQTGQEVVLSDRDVELIRRLQSGKTPDASFDDFAVSSDYGNILEPSNTVLVVY